MLPKNLQPLFAAMPVEDRQHGMQVLAALQADGATDPPVLQAGLLHDLGKAEAGVGVIHRVARVLLARSLPPLWTRLAGTPTGWRRPYWAVANHPERGAVWVASAGGSDDLIELVRHHENPPPAEWSGTARARWHAALTAADAHL